MQPHYNLHARQDYETDLAPVVAARGLSVIPYYSLASGFLTGKYQTRERAVGACFDGRGARILKALAAVSTETGAAQASIALAWLLAQPHIAAPIASATSVQQLEGVLAAADLRLTAGQLELLTVASAY